MNINEVKTLDDLYNYIDFEITNYSWMNEVDETFESRVSKMARTIAFDIRDTRRELQATAN